MPHKKETRPAVGSKRARDAKSKEIVAQSGFERSSLGFAAVYFAMMLVIFLAEIGVIP